MVESKKRRKKTNENLALNKLSNFIPYIEISSYLKL